MEGIKRKPFQGVSNIVRFNWQFYVFAAIALLTLFFAQQILPITLHFYITLFIILSTLAVIMSLSASYYIYDVSNLYTLDWLHFPASVPKKIVTINAGFDETSALLVQKYPNACLEVFDFYDPTKHTEVSIERARRAYPSFPGTITISTTNIPLKEDSTDVIFLILAAHEIRNEVERVMFFKQLQKALTLNGKIIVVEHQRDLANFLAYNFGFFHFHSNKTWKNAFQNSNLILEKEFKITPFISTFILNKNGITS
ncbi:MAG: methyltransferase [Bacteroidetes bacterium]|nr:methyltransferase [Bacteroidota bacterium]